MASASPSTASTSSVPERAPGLLGRVASIALQVALTLHALLLLVQPLWAGLFLSGDYERLATHHDTALVVMGTGTLVLVLAVAAWWFASWPTWLPIAAFALMTLLGMQFTAGFDRQMGLHIPLGTLLAVGTIHLVGWTYKQPVGPTRTLASVDPRAWLRRRRGDAATASPAATGEAS